MNAKFSQKLNNLNVVIVSHIFASGPALDLEEYLKDKAKSLFFVGHPFPYRDDNRSFYRVWTRGRQEKEVKTVSWKLPEVLFYLKDAFYTLFWVLAQGKTFDLYIGSDNFSAYLGLLLKRTGRVKNVVLYTIDYMPTRFGNPVMNWLYHHFDESCLKECRIVWNVSPRMAEARLEQKGIGGEGFAPQITVPLGMWHKRIPKPTLEKKNRYQMVFLGHILEKQGLDVVLEGLPEIIKKLPKTRLMIMGSGPHEDYLKDKTRKLKLEKYVEFRGFKANHHVVEEELSKSALGLAMYKPDPESFTYFADPAKLKNYLSARLPIVLTDVPPIAPELEKQKCALIAKYDKEDFANRALELLSNTKKLKEYGDNAVKFAGQFDWDNVFAKALDKTI